MSNAKLFDFRNIFSLKNKVAVITGGSRGLGLAAASGILQAGASKVFIVSRSPQGCEDACAELNKLPDKDAEARAIAVPADISTLNGIRHMVDTVSQSTDHVDILLANAGVAHLEEFDKYPEDKFSEVLNLNVTSAFYTIQQSLLWAQYNRSHKSTVTVPGLKTYRLLTKYCHTNRFEPLLTQRATMEDTSRVIVTSSVAGVGLAGVGKNGAFPYAAAKAGVVHLVKQLAVELGPRGILTNAIAPGFFPTELAAPMIESLGGEEALAKTYPNGRLGKGEDMAGTVVYLSSRAARHVNGRCIILDGGGVIGKIQR